ncbi:carboxypeptidase-like regulatory domain-containing protein [Collimonas sp.]|uniref:carboxypeptidase-like regulatory domain-containing protein n=1 Tax=Collimonas sp. TaxID=1963772 RepID=UPI002C130C1B|nr:carboxypeptidase-like regulatory domain-containing protein [Collimonas sp.]HWW05639.1 carboxypeptidase-like regulatory domain-containing protein [Collimonas sp.]
MNKRSLFILSVLMAANLAFAADATQGRLQPTTSGVASYLSGGIGEDEATAIQQAAKNYSLELEFVIKAAPKDEFTADIKVKVSDASHNTVLDTVSKGPFFLAQLPAGRYHLEASKNGQTKAQDVTIKPGSHQRIMFEWIE